MTTPATRSPRRRSPTPRPAAAPATPRCRPRGARAEPLSSGGLAAQGLGDALALLDRPLGRLDLPQLAVADEPQQRGQGEPEAGDDQVGPVQREAGAVPVDEVDDRER